MKIVVEGRLVDPVQAAKNWKRNQRQADARFAKGVAKQPRWSREMLAMYLLHYLRQKPMLTVDATRLIGRSARSIMRDRRLWAKLGVVLVATPAYTGEQRHIEWRVA